MASTPMLTGIGDPFAQTNTLTDANLGEEVLVGLELFEFEYNSDQTKLEAQVQRRGVKRVGASTGGEVTDTIILRTQITRWDQYGFFLNQLQQVESVDIPILKTALIPAEAPYTVSDAAITAGNLAGVYVYVSNGDESGYRTKGTAAPGVASVTDGTITFDASDAGGTVSYTVPVARTDAPYYGGIRAATSDSYGNFAFWGTTYPDERRIYFPSVDFSTTPSFSLTGDVATLEIEATPVTPTGWDFPYKLYKS